MLRQNESNMIPPDWYSWVQTIIFIFIIVYFLGLWFYGKPQRKIIEDQKRSREPALFWISLALMTWAFAGVCLLCINFWPSFKNLVAIILTFLSTLNSAFFLLAAAHLDYAFFWIRPLQDRKKRRVLVITLSIGVALITLYLISIGKSNEWIVKLPDALLSTFTISLFAISICVSFWKRRMRFIALFPAITCLLLLYKQYLELVNDYGDVRWYLGISSNIVFAITLLVLVISWLREIIENPEENDIYLVFDGAENGKWWITISISGILNKKRIGFPGIRPYEQLVMFAVARKYKPESGGWICLREKNWHQNVIGRICEPMKINHRKVFENDGSGSYKLLVAGQNIQFSPKILKDPEFQNALKGIS